jgi:hypothetical protein
VPHAQQIRRNETGAAYGPYGGEERGIQVLVGKHEGKNQLAEPGVDGG